MSLTAQSMNGAYIFTDRQRSCGKVMFSQVSVILLGGYGFPGTRSFPERAKDILGIRSFSGVGYPWTKVLSGGRVSVVPDPFQDVRYTWG